MYKLHIFPNELVVENTRMKSNNLICLGIEPQDLRTVDIHVIERIPEKPTSVVNVECIYGIYSLLSGPYLAVITSSSVAGIIPTNKVIFCASNMELFPVSSSSGKMTLNAREKEDERKYIQMIRSVIATKKFFYSFEYDITNSAQRIAFQNTSERKQPLALRADHMFFWNLPLVNEFMNNRLMDWVTPVMSGYIKISKNCEVKGNRFDFIFIARRSCRRVGTRFNIRGADKLGNVANFVETEMLVMKADLSSLSYVQIRGSIPLYWDQFPSLKYMPRTRYAYSTSGNILDWNENALTKHFEQLFAKYGKITVINLIDKNGKSNTVRDQAQLGTAFQKYTKKFDKDKLEYVWFDFHHECRNMKWENLKILMKLVEADFTLQGCFEADSSGRPITAQKGVFRVNCMDNLDRTNVAQSLFGRRCLLMALGAYDPNYTNVLDSPLTSFEKVFKNAWADNADLISVLYAGTGALKTDFTRTGKRTLNGAIQDGINSVMRYFLNNFQDGIRQDTYDLFVKNYIPDKKNPSPFTFQQSHSFFVFFLTSFLTCTSIGISLVALLPSGNVYKTTRTTIAASLTTFLLLGYLILKKGILYGVCRKFVCKPLFCPGGYPQT